MRQRQDEQRVRDARDARTESRHGLPDPEQHEVAVAAKRRELRLGLTQRRRRPLRARSSWRRICRFISVGSASVCSPAASRYARRSAELSRLIACCALIGSVAAPERWSFLIALASSGFWRSSAASEAFFMPRPSNGTFISVWTM